ncbi:MAG: HD domain-containing protein [Candidatus Niyogibacteria bacterium]|nr:HD domain-containing protein [Candidatus Niyogibacteria bacterium]
MAKESKKISGILKTFKKAEKLKSVLRCAYTSDGKRKESSADHSWMLALLAIIFFDEIKINVNRLKVLKMLITHDLAEAIAGDSYPWDKKKRIGKHEREERALQEIISTLPFQSKKEIMELWQEFERKKTKESRFAHAIDKVEVILQHNVADIKTWLKGDFDLNPYWKDEYYNQDPFLRKFKDQVNRETMAKIINAGKLSEVNRENLERYRRSKK